MKKIKRVEIPKTLKARITVLANFTDEDRHMARFMLRKGRYVCLTGEDGKNTEELKKVFADWFNEEYAQFGELVRDKDTGMTYGHLHKGYIVEF